MNFKPFAYQNLTFNSPLSEERAEALVKMASPANRILDLGCGWGELLFRVLEANPLATGIGIDTDINLIERARTSAAGRGLQDKATFVCDSATTANGQYDLVIAIGVTHIWGDVVSALGFLKSSISPNGKLVFGGGIWLSEPTKEIKEIFGELPTAEELHSIVAGAGLDIIDIEIASIEEWDDFESLWRSGLEASYDSELIAFAAERKREYEEGYRGLLGFCYLVGRSQ